MIHLQETLSPHLPDTPPPLLLAIYNYRLLHHLAAVLSLKTQVSSTINPLQERFRDSQRPPATTILALPLPHLTGPLQADYRGTSLNLTDHTQTSRKGWTVTVTE